MADNEHHAVRQQGVGCPGNQVVGLDGGRHELKVVAVNLHLEGAEVEGAEEVLVLPVVRAQLGQLRERLRGGGGGGKRRGGRGGGEVTDHNTD